jgi:hypothetical protein
MNRNDANDYVSIGQLEPDSALRATGTPFGDSCDPL